MSWQRVSRRANQGIPYARVQSVNSMRSDRDIDVTGRSPAHRLPPPLRTRVSQASQALSLATVAIDEDALKPVGNTRQYPSVTS